MGTPEPDATARYRSATPPRCAVCNAPIAGAPIDVSGERDGVVVRVVVCAAACALKWRAP